MVLISIFSLFCRVDRSRIRNRRDIIRIRIEVARIREKGEFWDRGLSTLMFLSFLLLAKIEMMRGGTKLKIKMKGIKVFLD